jgi:hypothetical protein
MPGPGPRLSVGKRRALLRLEQRARGMKASGTTGINGRGSLTP